MNCPRSTEMGCGGAAPTVSDERAQRRRRVARSARRRRRPVPAARSDAALRGAPRRLRECFGHAHGVRVRGDGARAHRHAVAGFGRHDTWRATRAGGRRLVAGAARRLVATAHRTVGHHDSRWRCRRSRARAGRHGPGPGDGTALRRRHGRPHARRSAWDRRADLLRADCWQYRTGRESAGRGGDHVRLAAGGFHTIGHRRQQLRHQNWRNTR